MLAIPGPFDASSCHFPLLATLLLQGKWHRPRSSRDSAFRISRSSDSHVASSQHQQGLQSSLLNSLHSGCGNAADNIVSQNNASPRVQPHRLESLEQTPKRHDNHDVERSPLGDCYPGCACDVPRVTMTPRRRSSSGLRGCLYLPKIREHLKSAERESCFMASYISFGYCIQRAGKMIPYGFCDIGFQ